MTTSTVSLDGVRELAGFRAQNGCAISLYLNLDPRVAPTAGDTATRVRSLLDAASKSDGATRPDLAHEVRVGLKADLERLESYFDGGFDRDGAHGLAVFSAGPDNVWRVLPLPWPVDDAVRVADDFLLAPLVPLIGRGNGVLVAVVGREQGRVLALRGGRLQEIADRTEETPGRHDQGGWSQARYERSVDREVEWHFDNAADLAWRTLKDELPDGLLLGGPQEVVSWFEGSLHPYLRARLAGRVEVDVEHTTVDEVHRAAAPVIERRRRELVDEALERLRAGLGREDGRAVAGLAAVLEALHERRVEHLLVDAGFHPAGTRCPQCEMLHVEEVTTCPADGEAAVRVGDVLEPALEAALGQDAEVRILRDRPDLGPHGHIAATLRF